MPTNAEIKARINRIIRVPKHPVLTNNIASILDDIIDNIAAGPGGTPGIDDVLEAGDEITQDRYIDTNGHTFYIQDGEISEGNPNYQLYISSAQKYLQTFNNTGAGNLGKIGADVSNDSATSTLEASFNGEESRAYVQAVAESGNASLVYSAEKHRFFGVQEFADNAAAISGGFEDGMLYYRTGHGLDIVIEEE